MSTARKERKRRARSVKRNRRARLDGGGTYDPGVAPRMSDWLGDLYEADGWDRPDFLAPYADALELAIPSERPESGDRREVVAAPPQHGKTELTLRAFLYWAKYYPGHKHAYVTYNQTRTGDVSKMFRRLAESMPGYVVEGNADVIEIRAVDDSGNMSARTFIKFSSVKGDLTGYALTGVGVVDDPIKDANDSRSPTVRKACVDWYKSVLRTRRHPGTSIICMATRWHMEDLSGYLLKSEAYSYINLKCIAEPDPGELIQADGTIGSDPLGRKPGQSLWHRKPPEFFSEEQGDKFWWGSMYQGNPRAEGTTVFDEPHYYEPENLPTQGYRVGFGIDLAYSKKTKADWSVFFRGVAVGGVLYLTHMERHHLTAVALAGKLKKFHESDPAAPVRWYTGGQEKSVVANLRKDTAIRVKGYPATQDKFIRATPVARAWNNGRVLLPAGAGWIPEMLAEVQTFTGAGDTHDDIVDALAALYDEIAGKRGTIGALVRKEKTG